MTSYKDNYVSQYIDFYSEEKERCRANCPDAMNNIRDRALAVLKEKGLPVSMEEDYKRFDVQEVLDKNYGIKLTNLIEKVNPYKTCRCNIGDIAPLRYYMLDDEIYTEKPDTEEYSEVASKGVYIGNIRGFEKNYPDVLAKYYGQVADMERNTLAALNSLFARDAFVVYVPKGVKLEYTVQLIMLSGGFENALIFPRILVILEDDAEASLLLCDHCMPTKSVTNSLSEVYVGNRAKFTLYDMEETHSEHTRIENAHYKLMEHAEAKLCPLTLTNGKSRNNIYGYLEGEYASFTAAGFAVLDGNKKADTYVWVNHSVPNCHSDQLIKYTLNDNAIGSFTGRIYVAQDAQKTQAYQNNKNLNLSSSAIMYSKPQLEIYADDVKCSHGLTIGQIDENALFYMRQRGVPYMEAKMMLTIAFMSEVLEYIDLVPLREQLQNLLEQRYRGGIVSCHNRRLLVH